MSKYEYVNDNNTDKINHILWAIRDESFKQLKDDSWEDTLQVMTQVSAFLFGVKVLRHIDEDKIKLLCKEFIKLAYTYKEDYR